MTTSLTQKDFKSLWSQLKASAKKRHIPFNLKPNDIDTLGIPITCPVLNIPLQFHKVKAKDNSISFDRIDSTKGYTLENLIIVSQRVNKLKSNATLEEMKKIVQFYDNLQEKLT
jgi:hypothetical protein